MTDAHWFIRARLKNRQLLLLVALDEHGNIHRAAEMLNMTQPAASKLLKDLEDMLGIHAGRSHQLRDAMLAIAAEGRGVVVLLRDMGAKLEIGDHVSPQRLRQYGIGAQILNDLGITTMQLMTNNPTKFGGLEGFGLEITGRVGLESAPNPENIEYLRTKRERMGHLLDGLD